MSKTIRIVASETTGAIAGLDGIYSLPKYGQVKMIFSIPQALRSKIPTSIVFHFYTGRAAGEQATGDFYDALDDAGASALQSAANAHRGISIDDPGVDWLAPRAYIAGSETIEQVPTSLRGAWKIRTVYGGMSWISISSSQSPSLVIARMISGGVRILSWADGAAFYSEKSQYPPYADITYDEGEPYVETISPTGFVDRTKPVTFSWRTTYTGVPTYDIAQQSASLVWRKKGEDMNHIIAVGADTTYEMPANTLPQSNDLYWFVITNTQVGSLTSEKRPIATLDTTPTVTAISPDGIYVDNTFASRFSWQYENETGTLQTRYELQVSRAGEAWQTVADEQSADTFADIPAGTLVSGETKWRVRGYNADGVPSDWSNELTCVVVSSPPAPSVEVVEPVPRPLIKWTAADQQAYKVTCGDFDSGVIFGADKTYRLDDILPDGLTVFSVSVMNSFGYWSPPGTATADIVNTPFGDGITLAAAADRDAHLTWTAADGAGEYRIYRDGVRIAETTGESYTDRMAIGEHTYDVYALDADGRNYIKSNAVTVDLLTNHPIIGDLDGEWISLELTATQTPEVTTSVRRDISLMQYNNAEYPVPETGIFKSRMISLGAAFDNAADAHRLEELCGKLVIYKNQYGDLLVGIFDTFTKVQNGFWKRYSFTLTEVDRRAYS